jgi:hypothetical protein
MFPGGKSFKNAPSGPDVQSTTLGFPCSLGETDVNRLHASDVSTVNKTQSTVVDVEWSQRGWFVVAYLRLPFRPIICPPRSLL